MANVLERMQAAKEAKAAAAAAGTAVTPSDTTASSAAPRGGMDATSPLEDIQTKTDDDASSSDAAATAASATVGGQGDAAVPLTTTMATQGGVESSWTALEATWGKATSRARALDLTPPGSSSTSATRMLACWVLDPAGGLDAAIRLHLPVVGAPPKAPSTTASTTTVATITSPSAASNGNGFAVKVPTGWICGRVRDTLQDALRLPSSPPTATAPSTTSGWMLADAATGAILPLGQPIPLETEAVFMLPPESAAVAPELVAEASAFAAIKAGAKGLPMALRVRYMRDCVIM
jgi:hypothetical protein